MKTCIVYLHSDKLTMLEEGQKIGLEGEVLAMFAHALSEVKIEIEVDEQTGLARVIAVDDTPLNIDMD